MRKIRLGAGFTVFVIFFGFAALDALQTADWLRVFFWIAVGFAFLYLDSSYESKHPS